MESPAAKKQKMENGDGCNGTSHGYGFDVGVDYSESSVKSDNQQLFFLKKCFL